MNIIFIGCDNSGKTTIAKELSKYLNIPYFKNNNEKVKNRNYLNALYYESILYYNFLKQTGYSCIRDRDYPCEYVYSKIFNRETDDNFILEIDRKYKEINTLFIYLYKDEYKEFKDDFINKEHIELVKKYYKEFLNLTVNRYIKINTTDEDLDRQITIILNSIK
jgi:thymidylate kinase